MRPGERGAVGLWKTGLSLRVGDLAVCRTRAAPFRRSPSTLTRRRSSLTRSRNITRWNSNGLRVSDASRLARPYEYPPAPAVSFSFSFRYIQLVSPHEEGVEDDESLRGPVRVLRLWSVGEGFAVHSPHVPHVAHAGTFTSRRASAFPSFRLASDAETLSRFFLFFFLLPLGPLSQSCSLRRSPRAV